MKIALDVMGGDHAPQEIIAGAVDYIGQSTDSVVLVGKEDIITRELGKYSYDNNRLLISHASQVIGMDESPAVALRKKKDASIVVATRLVKEGQAQAVMSCGSTGAQMAAALFILGRLENIERPPIVAAIPNACGTYSLMVDVGANVDCRPRQLLQFAVLGSTYASAIMGIDNPRVALLNNGEEESKGNSVSLEAYSLFKEQADLNFVGNIEGRDLFSSRCDVIVCDGFTGNIVLKTMEGMAAFVASGCVKELGRMPSFFQQIDYTRVGGAPLLGVDGVSIVCHGSSKREAVSNGLKIASQCVAQNMVELQKLALNKSL
jgi:glycerol-3-phosphate acyltransferase PlsX